MRDINSTIQKDTVVKFPQGTQDTFGPLRYVQTFSDIFGAAGDVWIYFDSGVDPSNPVFVNTNNKTRCNLKRITNLLGHKFYMQI